MLSDLQIPISDLQILISDQQTAQKMISRAQSEVRANQPPSLDWTGTGLGLGLS